MEPMIMVPVETLQELRSVIIGFQDDKRCNLMPRDDRLEYGRELIRSALDLPRTVPERHDALIAAE